ncbi:MAG TPA: T9SS type A sorting domain-containing protein [Flavobacteriales bacterium]|nr:T9SS type A sorting domain-containing protein [Flavobacteriales bacterium]
MSRACLFAFALRMAALCSAQKQGNIWYFGDHSGFDFSGGGDPALLSDGQTHFVDCPACHAEGSAVICDSTGMLLFYSDGAQAWNANHQVMPHGDGLLSNASSTQAALILPRPGSNRFFYLFTVDDFNFDQLQYGFRYSVVDMCMDGELGDVNFEEKNILLLDTVAEKLTAVRHTNGTDYWVIVHKFYSDAFHAYHLEASGITGSVVSHVGSVHPIGSMSIGSSIGQMKASPNGEKLVVVNGNSTPSIAECFDFDPATGVVSNALPLMTSPVWNYYGASFSPNSSKVYITSSLNGNGLYQFDLLAGGSDPTAIVASMTQIADSYNYLGLQLAVNGKIYVARAPFSNNHNVGVIHRPDSAGAACDFTDASISFPNSFAGYSFPSFVDSYDYSNGKPDCATTGIVSPPSTGSGGQIQVYPNPADDLVQLTVPDGGDTRVRITVQDATGREVLLILNGRLPADRRVQADLSDLASGAYMVVVQGAHGRSAVRLVRR